MSLSSFLTQKMISSTGSKTNRRTVGNGDVPAGGNSSGSTGYDDGEGSQSTQCSFCATIPAAICVMLPVLGSKTRRAKVPYCLRCYYTTSAVRQDPQKYVSVLDADEQTRQLPQIQRLFSECFLELQREISEESARAFQRQRKDPLAAMMLHHTSSNRSNKRKLKHADGGPPPDPKLKKAGKATDGGFLRDVSLPERLLKMQEQQARLQREQISRMNLGTSGDGMGKPEEALRRNARRGSGNMSPSVGTAKSRTNPNQRRKGSRKSIWNLAMDQGPDAKASVQVPSYKDVTDGDGDGTGLSSGGTCNCGSEDVLNLGNVTSRNQDVRKGEIWGTDRGNDVITRFQCNKCGKTWNEEG
jgi:hypothetical protein